MASRADMLQEELISSQGGVVHSLTDMHGPM